MLLAELLYAVLSRFRTVDLKKAATTVIVGMGSLQVGLIAIKRHFLVSTGKKTRRARGTRKQGRTVIFSCRAAKKKSVVAVSPCR